MSQMSTSTHEPRTWKAVYTIVERPGAEKKYWVRIGTAFTNRDQSLNVRLDANPVNGQIHIRDVDEEEIERARQRRQERASQPSYAGGVQ
jgi:hypothetical protein